MNRWKMYLEFGKCLLWDNLTSKKQDYLSELITFCNEMYLETHWCKGCLSYVWCIIWCKLKILQSKLRLLLWEVHWFQDNFKQDKVTWFDISTPEMKRQLELLRDGYAASIAKMTGANQWQTKSAPVSSPCLRCYQGTARKDKGWTIKS